MEIQKTSIFKSSIKKIGLLGCLTLNLNASPSIDKNVIQAYKNKNNTASVIIFFYSPEKIPQFIKSMAAFQHLSIVPLTFMPAVILTGKDNPHILQSIVEQPSVAHLALNEPAGEKIDLGGVAKQPKIKLRYLGIDRWWTKNFKGQSGVVGVIDSGIDAAHPAFSNKNIIINKDKDSGYLDYKDGIRTPHGTGVACIYSGSPAKTDKEHIRGVAYKASIILSTLAGEGFEKEHNFWQTFSGLNWFFSANTLKPSVINYSFGNGFVTCPTCPDWSGMSMVVDHIVNKYKILWVTSAGNNGFVKPQNKAPFYSSLTVPADNYNALTVANMNMFVTDRMINRHKYERVKEAISYSSSRGPTLLGRKKPDITAPGNDTYTCAPNKKYSFKYSKAMNYTQGYRYMGGTSSAAPHVGGAILLIREAGITDPLAIKALLINSADTWTDSKQPGPNDPSYLYHGGHHMISGSEWNPTYGWGFMNMSNAFQQKEHILMNSVAVKKPMVSYRLTIRPQDKITVVHERRVGFYKEGGQWKLSHLKLELLEFLSHKLLAFDDSELDTVHQVSLCSANNHDLCTTAGLVDVMVRITLVDKNIDGAVNEPFALVYS